MDQNSSLQQAQFQMIRLRASLTKAFMLNLALFSTGLLVLKKLFPEIDQTWQRREARQAEGFEGHHGDLVLELAKVFTQILILMKVITHFEVVALPPLVGTNISCKPPDLPRRWISSSLAIVAVRFSQLKIDQTGRSVRVQGLPGSFWRLQGRSSSSCLLALRWPTLKLIIIDGRHRMLEHNTNRQYNNTTMTVIFKYTQCLLHTYLFCPPFVVDRWTH